MISTIDVYIQDIAHHALLKQLEYYEAEHGCVVVMEAKTGEVKAISNLGIGSDGNYYETINYAVAESHEPGSTFKLIDLIALIDDDKVDTSKVYDSHGGTVVYHNRRVNDSKKVVTEKCRLREVLNCLQTQLYLRFMKIIKIIQSSSLTESTEWV